MKRFKTKKKLKMKLNFMILVLIIVFFILFIYLSFQKLNKSYNSIISLLLKESFFNQENHKITLSSNLDYLISDFFFNKKKEYIFKEKENIIYLYNTHDNETYLDNENISKANDFLAVNLKKIGILSIVEEKKTSNYLYTGLDYYDISKTFLSSINNDNISYYVDIHRDSVSDTTIVINNKKYAKVLFVLGLDNPKYYENQKVMEKMNNYLDSNYPGISKGILKKGGQGVNGVYNQDFSSNVILIEVGGVNNSLEEVENTTQVLSLMFYYLINDK